MQVAARRSLALWLHAYGPRLAAGLAAVCIAAVFVGLGEDLVLATLAALVASLTVCFFPYGMIVLFSIYLPFEAMIKRRPGFNPEGNDWEFVRLAPTPNGRTQIRADGKGEVTNALGSCQACHKAVAQQHDLVCGFVVGAAGLGLTEQQLASIQAGDPRCRKK